MKHNWEYKPLKQLSDILYGCPFESDFFNSEVKGMPLIRIRDVKPGFTSTYFNGSYSDEYLIKKGDYLIGMDGEFNIAPWQSEDALLNQRVCRVKSLNEKIILSNYIFYFLGKELKDIEAQTSFVTVKHLSAKVLSAINTPVPPMEVQEQIVAELDKINEVIEDCRELLRNLDALAQSLFYDYFGDPVSNPKGWRIKQLKDILCKIGSGATPKGGKQSYQGGDISLIRSLNVYNTYFKYDELAKINDDQAYELRNVEVQDNDVLLNITGASVARCFIVPINTLPARVNQHVAILRPINTFIQSTYLHRLLITSSFQNFLISMARGKSATRESLPKASLEVIEIPVPPLELQEKFASHIEQIEAQKRDVEATIAELQTLLDSRMDYWFN